MRKTILSVAIALFALATISANNKITKNYEVIAKKADDYKEINSFCKAIVKGDLDTVKKLIALGEDVNQKSLGKTPAIFAARYNRVEILKVLILNGADLSIKCASGYSIKQHAKLSKAQEALTVIEKELAS